MVRTFCTQLEDEVMKSERKRKVLDAVDRESIVEMSRDVIGISSPTGYEQEMGKYMKRTFEEMDLDVTWQQVEENRPNVIGRYEGKGSGMDLMFNGHMDTSYTGEEDHLDGIGYKPHPVVKDGIIYGLGIYNMKGALVSYTHALKALMEAGVELEGDVLIAAVAGEIEKSQWAEEYLGPEYRGYGAGSHHLVNHGIVPDVCILGEPTGLQVVTGHFGALWARITTRGPYMHAGFSGGEETRNSIWRMRTILEYINKWRKDWEREQHYGNKDGVINLGGIKGGHAWRASRTPHRTDLYLDIRVPPTTSMSEAKTELKQRVMEWRERHPDFGIEYETYVSRPGAEISEDHEMIDSIDQSHETVVGEIPDRDTVVWSSDASVLTRYDIDTVNYGPSSGLRGDQGELMEIQTLVNTSKIYALVAADLCDASS